MGDLFNNPFNTPVNVLQQAAEANAGYSFSDQTQRSFTQTNPAPASALDPSQLPMRSMDLSTLALGQDVAPIQVSFNWTKAVAIGAGIALLIYGLAHLKRSS